MTNARQLSAKLETSLEQNYGVKPLILTKHEIKAELAVLRDDLRTLVRKIDSNTHANVSSWISIACDALVEAAIIVGGGKDFEGDGDT